MSARCVARVLRGACEHLHVDVAHARRSSTSPILLRCMVLARAVHAPRHPTANANAVRGRPRTSRTWI
eukprot:1870297-Rhodomonas_salina.1